MAITLGLTLWSLSQAKGADDILDTPPTSLGPDEEVEEVTHLVTKDSWGDFYNFLLGNDEEVLETESVEKPVETVSSADTVDSLPNKPDPSFSRVMANIISSDSSNESSEDERHEKKSFPVN